ncbi:MAG: hypothetical protein ACO2O5_01245 [Candidatus Caldipriscus sp.]
MEVIRKFELLIRGKRDKVVEYVEKRLSSFYKEYACIPRVQYPYHAIGFIPVRVARFLPNEVSLYIEPGVYPVYSYLPFFQTVSILVPQKYAKFREKYAISIPENALYEVEIVLDEFSQINIENAFWSYGINIAFVFPISQSSFALPITYFGLYPFLRFENIHFGEPIYFTYEVCSGKKVYMLKPFMIYAVVQTLDEVWNNIENLEQSEEQSEDEEENGDES